AAERMDHVDAVEQRHAEIEHHEVGPLLYGDGERFAPVGGRDDVVAMRRKRDAQRADQLRIVICKEQFHEGSPSARGRATHIVTPPPGVSSRWRLPPMPSANPRDSA